MASLVLPEAPVPLHKLPPNKELGLVATAVSENVDRSRKVNKKGTTLTIVQDFPKKNAEKHQGVEMVQADHYKNVKKQKGTTLTIV